MGEQLAESDPISPKSFQFYAVSALKIEGESFKFHRVGLQAAWVLRFVDFQNLIRR